MNIKEKVSFLPEKPGCYLFHNIKEEIIYIGKAKNIKKRVSNYFNKISNRKTYLLVSQIHEIKFIITNNEKESLLLEINLIKKYKPKFNIKLIDDKNYPYIIITSERHPRLIMVRKILPSYEKKNIFGPFPNGSYVKEIFLFLQKNFPLRRCSLTQKKACNFYHLNLCLGSCIPEKKEQLNYQNNIEKIYHFFKGNISETISFLKDKMFSFSKELKFERANEIKKIIFSIQKNLEKQIIFLKDNQNIDFINFFYDEKYLSINIINMRQGHILDAKNKIFEHFDDIEKNILTYINYYYQNNLIPEKIFLPKKNFFLEEEFFFNKNTIFFPQKGNKKKILSLAYYNALNNLQNYHQIQQPRQNYLLKGLNNLETILEQKIDHIEVFDNSHLFQEAYVSAMIVFKNQKITKNLYRKFHLQAKDDYSAFEEVFEKRCLKIIKNNKKPDLICVDGSKGQVNIVSQVLKKYNLQIKIIGLQKNDKHKLTGFVYLNKFYNLDKNSPLFLFLLHLSEEVHRFALTFHQKTKKKKDFSSFFDEISGIGIKRKRKLLIHFSDFEKLQQTNIKELQKIGIPLNIGKKIIKYLINWNKK